MINTINLPPFKRMCMTIGNLPSSFLESMTYYEALCWLYDYFEKTLIPAINTNSEAITELQEAFITLKTYIDTYFDNLDIQEEVNNKLDDMAESGELTELITSYLQLKALYSFDTVNDLVNSENFIDGSFAKTLGFYNINDGGGANYKIRTILNTDVIDDIHLFAIVNDNTLVAELIAKDEINIKQLGAKNDIDNTDIINYALSNFKEVLIPEDTFEISDSLILKNGNVLKGYGKESVIILDKENTMPLISCENKNNVTIKNLTLKNDTSHTGSGIPDNLIGNFYNSNNITIEKLNVPIIYSQGIDFKKCGNIKIIDSNFSNAGHSMVVFLTETHDILIDNCVFDTITGSGSNDYLLATGSKDYLTTVDYLCKNLTVQNSRFLNNPNWEGLESHGCLGFYAYNNYVYNCKDGIHMYVDNRTPTTELEYGNVIIKNNTIINPNHNASYGIIVGGYDTLFANNIIIKDNIVKGTGSGSGDNAIYVLYANYIDISNNDISDFGLYAIRTTYCCHGYVNNNNIYAPNAVGAGAIDIGRNSWLITCDQNIINGGGLIGRAIVGDAYKGLCLLGNNICTGYTQYKCLFGSPNNTLIGSNNINSTRRLGCKGVYSVNDDGIRYMHCTDDVIRSIAETTALTVSGSVNTKTLTCSDNVINYVCPGQEIVITGANLDNSDLTTTICEIIGIHKFTIADTLPKNISNVAIKTTASTWVADV